VTRDVVAEFAADNVKYLELRTTPRDVPATRMTKSSYVASVVSAISAAVSSNKDIIVRLLLAIDRRMSPADIDETLKLAESYASQSEGVVVGLDLSGDPTVCALHVLVITEQQSSLDPLLHVWPISQSVWDV